VIYVSRDKSVKNISRAIIDVHLVFVNKLYNDHNWNEVIICIWLISPRCCAPSAGCKRAPYVAGASSCGQQACQDKKGKGLFEHT
jgi:hypothetical protein